MFTADSVIDVGQGNALFNNMLMVAYNVPMQTGQHYWVLF
jgi:hypothetical protein